MRWVRIIASVLASVILFALLLQPVPDDDRVVCKDGWDSPSIGRPGACSWHHGVDWGNTPHQNAIRHDKWSLFGSAFAGLVLYAILDEHANPQFSTSPNPKVDLIERAIREHKKIVFLYRAPDGPWPETRLIKPERIIGRHARQGDGRTRVRGFCAIRQTDQTFRLDRMTDIRAV